MRKEYDFAAFNATPEDFDEPMDLAGAAPPKLWLVWLYRSAAWEPKWTKSRLATAFGVERYEEVGVGRPQIFKNTADTNAALWWIKHLIDLRPITFPDGEPTADDIAHVEIDHEGRCRIDRKALAAPNERGLVDERYQLTSSYLTSRLQTRDKQHKDVFSDNVYNPANISIVD